ncbi:MAG: hypothetical protein DA329_11615, partial [Candidatus Nitrosocosmicus sp.]|nr:hypothetical protein [Candidatus Nitrosocosmicus sp.]
KYDATTGEFLSILIKDDGVMKKPQTIIESLDGNLYVISSGTNEILQYDIDKDILTKIVTDKSGGLYKPKDMEFNDRGDLCVNSLISNNIYCYNSENGKISSRVDISFNKGLPAKPHSEFSPDGEIFASNTLSNKISVYDRNTGFFSKIIISGEDTPLQNPRNLVYGPDGNLYVSSNNNNQIIRIDGKSGKFMDVFVEPINSGLAAPQGLAFHNGSLYVSSNENHRVLRYDQITGKFIDEFIKSRSGGLITPRGLVFDEMNHLYVSSNENSKILRYDSVTGKFDKEIASGGILSRPVGLAFDNNGNLLVSSSGNNQILSYDVKSSNPKPTIIISDESIVPQELVFDNNANSLYISSDSNNRILKYDFDSKIINEVDEITKAGLLEKPYGLTVKDNELFISNGLSDEILKYDITKKSLQSFNFGSIGVLGPSGLTFGPDKNIYVISSKTHEIFRYNANSGGLVGIFATFPYVDNTNSTRLSDGQLQDLVFSPDGKYMYVSSIFTNEILRFDGQTGKFIDVFIDKTESRIHPQNLVFSPDGKSLYVNNYETGSIFVYNTTTGHLINTIPSKNQDLASDVKNMKFGKNGDIYITDNYYEQIFRFNPNTGIFIDEFDPGGIELGKLEQNILKKKYLLNNINTTKYDTIVVYDQFLEKPFATITLEDNLLGNLPIPVVRDMLMGNIGIVEEPVFKSKPTEKWSGYFMGLNEIPTIGQVKVEQSEDIAIITLEVFEMRYKHDKYVSFNSDTGITKGPKIAVCLTDGKANTCNDKQNSVIPLGILTANVGDQVYVVRNANLEKFNTVLLFDNVLGEKFSETQLRHAPILRLSPQLFLDWTLYQFPSFPLLLLTFIAFPLTFDYVRTIFKIIFLSIYFTKKGKRQKKPKMSTKKKITIMIPAHNEEAGIKASIEAALKTKYKNKEIIVIDDGSTDNTYQIAKMFSEKGLIKLLHRKQASGSKAAALNYGFMYATGDLILCMDGDTLLVEDSLQNAVGYFDDEEVKAVSGNVKILSGDEDVTNTLTNAQKYEYLIAIELGRSFTSALNILLVISGAFGIFRRDIFSNTGKFDKDTITEDFDLTLKIRKTKGKIPFIRDSIARTYCPNNWKAWIKQRRRWAHGQMQTLKKHKDLMLSSKFTRRDRIAMFDMWALDIIMNFLFVIYLIILIPVSIIMIVYGNIHILVNLISLILITYLISETVIFMSA